ncbi:MAG: 2'-deoxycytidine 5'-triphosphate deaminase domain-containing protein, partial [Brevundimonas sp.]
MTTIDLSRAGILPSQSIETLIATGAITSDTPFDTDQVQPASLDLRLSD